VPQLIEAITAYIDEHNENPAAFEWTAKADDIIEKVRRAREVLDKSATA
jgi:selenocysteine lyase/cysteine desulfurase